MYPNHAVEQPALPRTVRFVSHGGRCRDEDATCAARMTPFMRRNADRRGRTSEAKWILQVDLQIRTGRGARVALTGGRSRTGRDPGGLLPAAGLGPGSLAALIRPAHRPPPRRAVARPRPPPPHPRPTRSPAAAPLPDPWQRRPPRRVPTSASPEPLRSRRRNPPQHLLHRLHET